MVLSDKPSGYPTKFADDILVDHTLIRLSSTVNGNANSLARIIRTTISTRTSMLVPVPAQLEEGFQATPRQVVDRRGGDTIHIVEHDNLGGILCIKQGAAPLWKDLIY